jgi:hypothetical protein
VASDRCSLKADAPGKQRRVRICLTAPLLVLGSCFDTQKQPFIDQSTKPMALRPPSRRLMRGVRRRQSFEDFPTTDVRVECGEIWVGAVFSKCCDMRGWRSYLD